MSNRYRILFVDDEERVLRSLKSIFRRDYDVYVATSGFDALEILSQQSIDVIVSDQRMPNMSGNELLAFVCDQYPSVMRILLTGYVDKADIVDTINRGEIYRYISKPWNIDKMKATVADAAKASRQVTTKTIKAAEKSAEPFRTKRILDDDVVSNIKAVLARPETLTEQERAKKAKAVKELEAAKTAASTLERKPLTTTSKTKRSISILLLDKDQKVRNSVRTISRRFGIGVYTAPSMIQAVRILAMRPDIGVVIMGISVDTRDTMESLNLIKQKRSDLSVVVLADVTDANVAIRLINEGQVFRYLEKPIDPQDFDNAIVAGIKRHHMLKKVGALSDRYQVEESSEPTTTRIQKLRGLFQKTA